MTHTSTSRIWFPTLILLMAIALLGWGQFASEYKVFDDLPQEDDPFLLFETITDTQMVIESTYGGVSRSPENELYFNYDRTEALTSNKPCPT